MIKKIVLLFVSGLIPFLSEALDSRSDPELLKCATISYLKLIDQISCGHFSPEDGSPIISPSCKKILNGQLYTETREDFLNDLYSVYSAQGSWKIRLKDLFIDPESNASVLRLFIEMEKLGIYTAIVILRYDSDYLITEINEVLTQVTGSYNF
ncbi:hypothetical protein [Criblamydia sequanensis]|uniref:Secreted protein n=1 Tax=Candidatus Criblamydia sequanensis CRIB-18 TaxID=1437425 RepID=A0A090CY91_9BACT|nr:hypothetical protein [Criblamydia sequanensis]CDR33221.1 putative secreted protein [Criblamydia sequanensis CRIB-18]